ncbi:MAG: phosphatidylglycerophosphatase A [Phycisphaerales bacterium]
MSPAPLVLPRRGGLSRAGALLVTTFGLGYLRPASGTWGSLPSVALAAALMAAGAGPAGSPWVYNLALAAVAVFFTLACAAYGDAAEARYLRKDPSNVVADETAGQAVALLFIPAHAAATPGRAAVALLAAFLLFRLLDILKPFPAGRLQRVAGGWGIVLDDLFAGVYALAGVQLITRLLM